MVSGETPPIWLCAYRLLGRADDPLLSSTKSSRKWRSISAAVLTGSQLLLFRDRTVLNRLERHRSEAPEQVIDFTFTPDEVISLHDAFAVKVEEQVRTSMLPLGPIYLTDILRCIGWLNSTVFPCYPVLAGSRRFTRRMDLTLELCKRIPIIRSSYENEESRETF